MGVTDMKAMPYMIGDIKVTPIQAALGAFIDCGDLRKMTADRFKYVRQAWLEHLVLVFRGHQLDDGALLDFCKFFGVLGLPPPPAKMAADQAPRDSRYPEIGIISNVVENGLAIGAFGAGEAVWHTDMAYEEIPHDGTMLYSLEIPPAGGDTWFGNMYYAYDTLPKHLLALLKGKSLKHDLVYKPDGKRRKGFEPKPDVREMPGTVHPIIRTHPETGGNSLYLGQRRNAYIMGLSIEESEKLLNEVWAHVDRAQFIWNHRWQVGDLLVWDNRCVMHRRDSFDEKYRRVMHQARVTGTKPFESEKAYGMPPHQRGFLEFQTASLT
jgi:taurine dioxygenase